MENFKQLFRDPLDGDGSNLPNLSHNFFVAQMVLRLLIVLFTAIAIVVMATSVAPITIVELGINFTARYTISSAFKFLMGANIVVCALGFLSLAAKCFLYPKPTNLNHVYFFFVHDLIMMVLMISACGAASAIGYVAVNGQPQTLWFNLCDEARSFCLKNGIAVAFSYFAFLCLFALIIMSSFKLHSKS